MDAALGASMISAMRPGAGRVERSEASEGTCLHSDMGESPGQELSM